MKSLLSFTLLLLVIVVSATSTTGDRLLVLLDDATDKTNYTKFLGDLGARGYQITVETPKSESVSLFLHGERAYDHVFFFPSRVKALGPNLTAAHLLDFMKAQGNIMLTLCSGFATPSNLVAFLTELDIGLPGDRTGLVMDHFNYDTLSASDLHDVLVLPLPGFTPPDMKGLFSYGTSKDTLLAFPRAVGADLGPGPLLNPILRAPPTAYSDNPKEQSEMLDDLFGAGKQVSLVSFFQARNSARFALVGSAEMLSDKWMDAKVRRPGEEKYSQTQNREFARRVTGWTFQETGVLKVNWIQHHLDEAGSSGANELNRKIYRVKNYVTYTISLSEWSWDKWAAFTVPPNDAIQLEFSMLSPFHRLPLYVNAALSTPETTAYTTSFQVPDQYGIFNFMVNYKRPLLTNIEEKNTVSVRHVAHNEWHRSYAISGAWPWVAGIGATIVGWMVFVVVWMFSGSMAPDLTIKKNL